MYLPTLSTSLPISKDWARGSRPVQKQGGLGSGDGLGGNGGGTYGGGSGFRGRGRGG